MKKKKAEKALAAPQKGFTRVEAQPIPFWSPNDEDAQHPNPLVCAYLGNRTIKARGNFPEQAVIEVEEEGTGTQYTVALKGNLPSLVRAAKLGIGQVLRIEWVELLEATQEMPHGMNRYDLQVQE